jgi:hypothetical protein
MQKLLTSCGILFIVAACAAPDAEVVWDADVAPLATPAPEGSGEPFLSTAGDAVYLSWLQESAGGGHDLMLSSLAGDTWTEPRRIAHGERFFVNWADFPSVVPDASGRLWAHWLERGDAGGYDYGIRVAHSDDAGMSWSRPWTPHEDGTPTEHGFVSILPLEEGIGLSWLDGRQFVAAEDGSAPSREMTVRFRTVDGDGTPGPEELLDARGCDCCQTDAALTDLGPVVVYRDRSEDEIRDIYITRRSGGSWTAGVPVHRDGWNIAGCPVNGPAVAAQGRLVAVAWFTAAGDQPKVKVAFSEDGGATFGPPVHVDDGNPAGRVDLALQRDGSAVVSWLERTGGEGAAVRLRRVTLGGSASSAVTVATSSSGRASGFPRMVRTAAGDLIMAWTDVRSDRAEIRVARVEVPVS